MPEAHDLAADRATGRFADLGLVGVSLTRALFNACRPGVCDNTCRSERPGVPGLLAGRLGVDTNRGGGGGMGEMAAEDLNGTPLIDSATAAGIITLSCLLGLFSLCSSDAASIIPADTPGRGEEIGAATGAATTTGGECFAEYCLKSYSISV